MLTRRVAVYLGETLQYRLEESVSTPGEWRWTVKWGHAPITEIRCFHVFIASKQYVPINIRSQKAHPWDVD